MQNGVLLVPNRRLARWTRYLPPNALQHLKALSRNHFATDRPRTVDAKNDRNDGRGIASCPSGCQAAEAPGVRQNDKTWRSETFDPEEVIAGIRPPPATGNLGHHRSSGSSSQCVTDIGKPRAGIHLWILLERRPPMPLAFTATTMTRRSSPSGLRSETGIHRSLVANSSSVAEVMALPAFVSSPRGCRFALDACIRCARSS